MAFVGELVQTPYGPAKIQSFREDKSIVLIPLVWRLANRQEPYLFLNSSDVKSFFAVNDSVKTQYGTGHIVSIRESDGVYVVILESWHLATGKSPVLYLQAETIQLIKSAAPQSIAEKAILAAEDVVVSVSHEVEIAAEKIRETVEEAEANAAPVIEKVTHEAETFIEKASQAVKESYAAAEEKAAPIIEEATKVVEEVVEIARDVVTSIEEATGMIPASKFHVGDQVLCVYGKGVVRQVRSADSIVVEPSAWLLANNKSPVFYLNSESLVLESEYNATKSETAQSQQPSTDDKSPAAEPAKKKGCTVS